MDQPMTFTPHDVVNIILGVCGAIITISGAIAVIVKAIDKAKEPNKKQDERLAALEGDVKKINERLQNGDGRFQADAERIASLENDMKETNKVIIESLQALTAHAIDGNNTQELKDSKKRLDDYLINRL